MKTVAKCALLLALTGCEPIEGGPDDPEATDTAEPTDPAEPTEPRPDSHVPAEVAGRTWWWVSTYGGDALTIAADGDYTSDVFVDAHPGESCGTEFTTHYAGYAVFDGTAVTLTPVTSERTKLDSCDEVVVSVEAFEGDVRVYEWRLESSDWCAEGLVLTGDDGYASTYCAD
jgi:hypothetical protein